MWVRMQADYGLSLAHPEGLPKTIQERALADIAGVLDAASVFRSNDLTDLFGEEETKAILRGPLTTQDNYCCS